MNIKTINDLLSYVETEEKAQRLINYINSLENYVKMKEIDIREFSKENYYNKLEIERLNKIRQQVIDELFELKDMIYKPETREINFDVQRKISSMIVKLGSDKE